MKIESLLPVLLGIINRQAGKQQQTGTTQQKSAGEILPHTETNGIRPKASASIKESEQPDRPQNQAQNPPDFLPLPLKSPLFPASRYYLQRHETGHGKGARGEQAVNLFINIETINLGGLWLAISSGPGELTVKFYTEEENFTHIIMEGFTELTRTLEAGGFSPVKLTAQTRPGIKSCADIALPGTYSPGKQLIIDLKI